MRGAKPPEPARASASGPRFRRPTESPATQSLAESARPVADFWSKAGKTRRDLHHTEMWASAFAWRVRALFGNSVACILPASRDGPRDQALSICRAYWLMRSNRPCRFPGLSRLGARLRERRKGPSRKKKRQNKATVGVMQISKPERHERLHRRTRGSGPAANPLFTVSSQTSRRSGVPVQPRKPSSRASRTTRSIQDFKVRVFEFVRFWMLIRPANCSIMARR